MPHLVQLDHDGTAFRLGLLGVDFGEALDPGLHRGRRHAEQLGGAVHRQPAQVQQQRLDLDPQRHATGRRVSEVQPARFAAVALLAAHEAVLDVLLAPAPLAPQRHPLIPSAVPLPTHMGDLCGLETLPRPSGRSGSAIPYGRRSAAAPRSTSGISSMPDINRQAPAAVRQPPGQVLSNYLIRLYDQISLKAFRSYVSYYLPSTTEAR